MAGTGGRPSTERGRTTDDARDELQRVLERDTAVQGERAEESPAANRAPAGTEVMPPEARPTQRRKRKA